nr:bacteriophage T7-related protein [uncultured bacterium]
MQTDYWRDVPGYVGHYQVSRFGEVRSVKRNKLLALVPTPQGYFQVNLYRNGRVRNHLAHRLVAAAFIGPIPPGHVVNHINADKRCNDVENLEIVTPEENRDHAKRSGLLRRGEENPKAKLTEAEVKTIRLLREEGLRVRSIANRYDITDKAVYDICNRISWRHVE